MTLFISHATADDTTIDRLAHALSAAGIPVWVDHHKGLMPGDDWSKGIEAAVNTCTMGLFVASPTSVKSDYCRAEWNRILALQKPLYVALIEPVAQTEYPLRLGTIQYANLAADWDMGLQALIEAILGKRDLDPAHSSPLPQRMTGSAPRSYFDLPLIGREADMQAVLNLLTAQRTVWVTGLGGIGKTRLALEIADKASTFSAGVVWHKMDDLSSPDGMLYQVRDHLGLPHATEPSATWASLARHALLLILDNAESCKTPKAYVEWLSRLDTRGGTRVLLTSRHHWRELKGVEHALAAPDAESAQQILAAMVALYQPNFTPDGLSAEMVKAARYHPRLLEYAVGWLAHYPARHVLRELQDLKGVDAQEALEDMLHKTLRQIESLPDGAALIADLKRATVFRGGFTYEAAEAVLHDIHHLRGLHEWQLIRLEKGRYEVPPLVIDALGTDPTAHQPHYDYYLALARDHHQRQDYVGLDVESENLDAAWDWALETDPSAAYWLANACENFQRNRGRFQQNLDWMQAVLPLLTDDRDRAACHNSLGIAYWGYPLGERHAHLHRAIAYYQQADAYYQQHEPQKVAMTQNNMGNAYANLATLTNTEANLQNAIDAFTEALRFYTRSTAPFDYAAIQNNLGEVYRNLAAMTDPAANLQRAIDAYTEALHFYTPSATPLDYAMTQHNIGAAYSDLARMTDTADNLQHAFRAYTEALRFHTPNAAPLDYAMTQNNMGNAYANLATLTNTEANLQNAIDAYTEALRFRTRSTAPFDYAAIQIKLGEVYRNLAAMTDPAANLQRAIDAYTEALRFYTPSAAPLDYAMTQRNLGLALNDKGDLAAAIRAWCEAERYYRLMGFVKEADMMRGGVESLGGRCED